MERNRLDPDEPPMIGAEPQPSMRNALLQQARQMGSNMWSVSPYDLWPLALMGVRLPSGARITGGSTAPAESSAGLSMRPGMVPGEEPLYRAGAYGDRHPGVSEPANMNNANWHKSQNPNEKYWTELEAQQFDRWARDNPDQLVGSLKDIWRERHPRPFDVIQGGLPPKKD